MLRLALIGKDITHSRSQFVYEEILGRPIEYGLWDLPTSSDIPCLDEIFNNIDGLSITSPYKEHFLEFVRVDDEIAGLRAINCIKPKVYGEYSATNTDYLALKDLIPEFGNARSVNFTILGDGVMARVTKAALELSGYQYRDLSRKKHGDLNTIDFGSILLDEENPVIINTCSRDFIFSNPSLPSRATFWDYNYAIPCHSEFFSLHGVRYIDGLALLKKQAIHALSYWGIS